MNSTVYKDYLEECRRMIHIPQRRVVRFEIWMRDNWHTFKMVLFYGDTVTVRGILMVASMGQAFGFLLPLGTLDRPYFADMRWLPSWAWGALYALHAAGQWWRFRAPPNILAGFGVNLYGFVLWTFTTMLATASTGTYSPSTALEWTVICALLAALVRTGDPADRMSP